MTNCILTVWMRLKVNAVAPVNGAVRRVVSTQVVNEPSRLYDSRRLLS